VARTLLMASLLLLLPCGLSAQIQAAAPVERRTPGSALPDAPQPAYTPAQMHADKAWERLGTQSRSDRPELRIQATGDPIRCDLDGVTPDGIFCTQHGGIGGPLFPKGHYYVPRREIREIRVGGRVYSTLLGLGIGVAVGTGLGSIHAANREDGAPAILALLCGGAGALIGHALPLRGTPMYRQP